MKGKKLCLVIPSLQPGGMERVMSELAGYFCQKGTLSVHLILYGRDPQIFYSIPKTLIVHLPKRKFNNNFRTISTIMRLRFLRNEIHRIDPDSILSFGEYWNSFVLLALLGLNYSVFVSDRCRPDKHFGQVHERLRKWLYRKAAGIIVQTNKAKEINQKVFNQSNIKVIGNPIKEISLNAGIDKENIILTVGRLIPSKNHSKMIDIFLRINRPEWKLIIVGGNALNMNLMDELRSKVKALGAETRIILTGNRSDVEQFYKMSKIFIFTSESEGFPNVIGEAMSAGLPVVAFDCIAGPSELISDGRDGFLVPIFDYAMLEQKLIILMNDSELRDRMGCEAKKSIKNFSVEKIGEKYYSFIMSET